MNEDDLERLREAVNQTAAPHMVGATRGVLDVLRRVFPEREWPQAREGEIVLFTTKEERPWPSTAV